TSLKEGLKEAEVVFIAVGTPQRDDGEADLQYVEQVARGIGKVMERPLVVVNKSTVPVGTADLVRGWIKKELKGRIERGELDEQQFHQLLQFDVVSNPEFLKEGDAINDFMKPDRVIVGADNPESMELLRRLYRPFTMNHERFIGMDIRSAELTKYAANGMLATKISFINEIAKIAEKVGADINKVRIGIGSDHRIGYHFIYPGVGYGGSCFPKDVQALIKIAEKAGVKPRIVEAVQQVNREQRYYFLQKILDRFGEDLTGKKFGIWGLSFKPETDDMREAPSITIIRELVKRGANVQAYDPKAIENAKKYWLKGVPRLQFTSNKYDALNGVDGMVLVTEWKEFRSPDWYEMAQRMRERVIFDGRNQYDWRQVREYGFEYYPVGVSPLLIHSPEKSPSKNN
ncbi:MAG: UDP-glucose/GDP-mannose dehydrogenase family protein, partial [Campylobacterales bacterium]